VTFLDPIMNKRTFIKLTSALMATPLITPLVSWLQEDKLKNWAGNITYSTDKLYDASSLSDVKKIITKQQRIKVLGTRHCFNDIADSKDNFISLLPMHEITEVNSVAQTVTLHAGMKYGELAPLLNAKGFALHNLASLPHISVAGACITGTHGSGVHNKNLSAAVTAFEFMDADGNMHALSKQKDGEKFRALMVNLGALGVLTSVTLQVQPTYNMKQFVFQHLSFDAMKENFEAIMSAGYSVSLFTDWIKDINEVWVKQKTSEQTVLNEFFGAHAAIKNLHPIVELPAENCTEQMGVPGVWYERLPHFKMGFTPSSGKELQAEYFVPHVHAVEAIMAVSKLGPQISPHLFISEIRTIDADDLWMSPCYKQPCVAIHFTWKQEWDAVKKLLPVIEKTLSPYNVKPHWGKLFTITGKQLHDKYDKMTEFIMLLKEYDEKGKFRNDFLNRNIFLA
jgi:xylitol oxidase